MKLGKIRPTATIVAQFAAGVEVEAIQHEGKMFLPIVGMGEFAVNDEPTAKKKEPIVEESAEEEEKSEKKSTKKSSKEDTKSESKTYTEDELMEMETSELLKMCKSMGIDPDATKGKNTNKKLRTLILEAQEGVDEDADDDDEDTDAEEAEDNSLTEQISELLEDFDGGKKNKKKTIIAICNLVDDADKNAVTELLDEFEDAADADVDKTAEKIAAVLSGEELEEDADDDEDEDDEEEEEKPTKKSKKSTKDEDLVDVKDLKVGDRVSVWWDDDNQDWFDGEVKSISKRGTVTIAYDDDTEDAIDPEVHTKIKLLED